MRKRENLNKRIVNRIDPVYLLLDRVIFKLLFRPTKPDSPGEFEKITASEEDFLLENLGKHRIILWINIIAAAYLLIDGLEIILGFGNTSIVVSGLLAPAMITGTAWYAVSFGGIPEKFISVAYYLTLAMFTSFTLSMTLLTLLLVSLTPWVIGLFIIIPIYLALYAASVLYDNVDGLKIGLDSTLLKFSRANLNYYQKHGYLTSQETQEETFKEGSVTSGLIAQFTYYLKTLDRQVEQLERERGLTVANHIIASSTDLLFSIIDLFVEKGATIRKDSEYNNFIMDKYIDNQIKVDELTLRYLNQVVSHLSDIIDDKLARIELEEIKSELNRLQDDISNAGIKGKDAQHYADHRFAEAFRKISELASAYRSVLFSVKEKRNLDV